MVKGIVAPRQYANNSDLFIAADKPIVHNEYENLI